MKKVFVIDGNKFSDLDGFFTEVQRQLTKDLRSDIGHNMDALNEVLRGGMGRFEVEEPVTLVWKNSRKSRSELGHAQAVAYLEKILVKCHPDYKKRLSRNILDARNGTGPTLFEMLVSLITSHPHVTLTLD